MKLKQTDLKDFLEEKYHLYNQPEFIEPDPISIPHLFKKKEDREIAGFMAATIAWGQRKVILRNANWLMEKMDHSPHEFIVHFEKKDLLPFRKFSHRTFNGTDCIFYLKSLQKIYLEHKSLENLFRSNYRNDQNFLNAITGWRNRFFLHPHETRTEKHFADPVRGSAAKRINMFLRWMIRKDDKGVDFGIWNMNPSLLTCPLDVHSARVARKLGLLKRKSNDWLAAVELTDHLRHLDAKDPVKYDFALFGLGVNESF